MSKRKIADENRKFSDVWTEKYFFVDSENKITCLICNFTISACKEYNLKRHYETKHPTFANLTGDERAKKLEKLNRSLATQKSLFKKTSSGVNDCVEVSLKIAAVIAKTGRPFTDGEFAKECLLVAAEKICPESLNKFKNISLSRMTIQRRIEDISTNLTEQLKDAAAKFVHFSLAADESTDISSTAQLLLFVRGVSEDFIVTEELVGMSSMKSTTTGADIFSAVLNLCKSQNLDLNKITSITTDGAPSMTGIRNGMVSLLRKHLGERKVIAYHCIIHQEQLCAKELGFDRLMKLVTDAINFIRSHALNHRQFKEMLLESDADHSDLQYYSEVRWLSRGECLKKFYDLLDEVIIFLEQKDRPTRFLKEDSFKHDLAFLVDVSQHLNDLNKKLMGKDQLINQLANFVNAFKAKLSLFSKQLDCQNFINFPHLKKIKEKFPEKNLNLNYSEQIKKLKDSFENRFSDFEDNKIMLKLFGDPFGITIEEVPEDLQLEVIDLQNCDKYRANFREMGLLEFYKNLPEFPKVKENARMCATMFGSTYICEQTFSLMNINKSKYRNKLTDTNLQSILKIATSRNEPNFKKIISQIQAQPSH